MNIFSPLKKFSSRLTRIGKKEPLHFVSLALIIALDIFVLVNLFQGLYLQKQELDRPSEIIPYKCENFLIHSGDSYQSVRDQKMSVLRSAMDEDKDFDDVHNKHASGVNIIENENRAKVDSRCRELYVGALSLNSSKKLGGLVSTLENLQNQVSDYSRENSRARGEYDTMLLEKIADQKDSDSLTRENARNVKQKIQVRKNKIADLESRITKAENSLLTDSQSQKFLGMIAERQKGIEARKASLEFWYPLKKIGVQMIFLLPLFFFFLWLYRRMMKKENSLMSLIASHLLLVTIIPVVLKVFELLLDILPFHFLGDLLEVLEALNIIALFNYLLILVGIFLAIIVIYFLQKKVFSAQKIWEKRIQKKQCWSCGLKKASEDEDFCSFCGEAQTEKCSKCGGKKLCKTQFCRACGGSEKSENPENS